MASRVCPKCGTQISPVAVAALSNGITCPNCHTLLEAAPAGRMLGAWAGLIGGYLAWLISHGGPGQLGAILPFVYAFLTFGVVSAIVTMVTGDVRLAAEPPLAVAAHGHGGGHGHDSHDSHGHGDHH